MSEPVYEPLTPVQCEGRLFRLTVAHEAAEKALTETRDALVSAQEELISEEALLKFAIAEATLDPECPVAGRAPGETTIAVRDAWVVRRTREERQAVADRSAVVLRKRAAADAARSHLTALSKQMMAAQSLLKSANEAYRGAGAR
jgi:hypothetical protein